MFTGIIQFVGTVRRAEPTRQGRRLFIDLGPLAEGVRLGDSVAVNGACLTAASLAGSVGAFDVVAETLSRTTLGTLSEGARVNLERAMRLGEGLEGHIVQGHIDGTGTIERTETAGGQWLLHVRCDKALTDEMVSKGSVALSGVSLTLAGVADGRFHVALIPTTLAETTLQGLRVGDAVNIETDVLGKYVRRLLGQLAGGDGLTIEKLRQAGFA